MSRFKGSFAAGLAVAVVAAVAGCGSNSESRSPASANQSQKMSSATSSAALDVAALDTYRPSDVEFFGKLRLEGAMVLRPPASLNALSAGSSVTLAASVTDVRATGMAGSTPILEIILKPEKVLHGKLQGSGSTIRVATIGLGEGTGAQQAASLRSSLPQGQSLWFLRWQGELNRPTKPNAPAVTVPTDPDLYALTHAFGVLVQGPSHVEAPLTEVDAPREGFVREAEGIGKVTQAVSATG